MKRQLTVSRDQEFSYEIYLREDFCELPSAICEAGLSGKKVCIVSDCHVAPYYLEQVKELVSGCAKEVTFYVMEAGEEHKNINTVEKLYEHLILHHIERSDYLLALGGGVIGDLTGFAAATYLRGIPFIQVPTTLLSQVDSSIGGKTGVDFLKYKNIVGAFHQPLLVYMNLNTLNTLPDREFACGMGEVLKTGLIWDKEYYNWLLEKAAPIMAGDLACRISMIHRCCEIKGQVVQEDPKEQGLRAILNFGHTIGHAVEKLMDFQLLHGQCVGLGMLSAAYISKERGLLTKEELAKIYEGNQQYKLPTSVSLNSSAKEVLLTTKSDKKMAGGHVKFILLNHIGEAFIDTTVTDEEILAGIAFIREGGGKIR